MTLFFHIAIKSFRKIPKSSDSIPFGAEVEHSSNGSHFRKQSSLSSKHVFKIWGIDFIESFFNSDSKLVKCFKILVKFLFIKGYIVYSKIAIHIEISSIE
ncbi:hypothetical protein BpHYR1_009136 [Brachionus plicatilis]|uniref:Uncharacterized protein n=1 Tax=Brachionus plicatilis TaxID=10195 RepID=A0A3M7Q1F2_BRAPC|nr:hypothetical protein BpHYR1_009136 [Brachionus plicatilis]